MGIKSKEGWELALSVVATLLHVATTSYKRHVAESCIISRVRYFFPKTKYLEPDIFQVPS
jgi:hypothetical protein